MARRIAFIALFLILGGVPSGCAATRPTSAAAPPLSQSVIGRSVQGRDITCFTLSSKAASINVMFIATIHGDEPAGTPLVQRLLREAQLSPEWMRDRNLIAVPIVNPDGYALKRRTNARGIDLNRNFPASSFTARKRHGSQPLSEPESRALHDAILQHRPDRIISFHQPIACIDYDGPGLQLAQAMAAALEPAHRLRIDKLGAYPGSLGSFAGEGLGIPIITVELPAAAHTLNEETLWQHYGPMLIAAVEFHH